MWFFRFLGFLLGHICFDNPGIASFFVIRTRNILMVESLHHESQVI
jgi:hypothetical protein